MAKKRARQDSTSVAKSMLDVNEVQRKVEEGVSNVIPMYCYHFGDAESKPPVEAKVCSKISPENFCCTTYTSEHTSPAKKCGLRGFTEEGIPEVVLGCAFSPFVEFETLRKAWENKGGKINPLKASKRARRKGK